MAYNYAIIVGSINLHIKVIVHHRLAKKITNGIRKKQYRLVAQLNLLPAILDNALIMQFKHAPAELPNFDVIEH